MGFWWGSDGILVGFMWDCFRILVGFWWGSGGVLVGMLSK